MLETIEKYWWSEGHFNWCLVAGGKEGEEWGEKRRGKAPQRRVCQQQLAMCATQQQLKPPNTCLFDQRHASIFNKPQTKADKKICSK